MNTLPVNLANPPKTHTLSLSHPPYCATPLVGSEQQPQISHIPLMYKTRIGRASFSLDLQQLSAKVIKFPRALLYIYIYKSEIMVLTEEIEALKRQSEDGEAKVREETYRRDKEQETTETAAIIEEIIEGISLQNRRGTIVRTISAIIR